MSQIYQISGLPQNKISETHRYAYIAEGLLVPKGKRTKYKKK